MLWEPAEPCILMLWWPNMRNFKNKMFSALMFSTHCSIARTWRSLSSSSRTFSWNSSYAHMRTISIDFSYQVHTARRWYFTDGGHQTLPLPQSCKSYNNEVGKIEKKGEKWGLRWVKKQAPCSCILLVVVVVVVVSVPVILAIIIASPRHHRTVLLLW